MDLIKLLEDNHNKIIEDAYNEVSKGKLKGYSKAGQERTKTKLSNLFRKSIQCIRKRELIPMLSYMEKIAKERYSSGFDLFEVQTAINSLEAAIWSIIFKHVKPNKLAECIGLVSTVLGAGKDHLARTYVSLATKTKTPSLNLQNLFSGSESIVGSN